MTEQSKKPCRLGGQDEFFSSIQKAGQLLCRHNPAGGIRRSSAVTVGSWETGGWEPWVVLGE